MVKLKETGMLGNEKLRVYLEASKLKLFWEDLELTKGLSFHTALNIDGSWHDSSNAQWQAVKVNQHRLHICVSYRDVPVLQNWIFTLSERGELFWEVSVQLKEPLDILHRKIGIFVSDKYTHWLNSCEQGEFPSGFNWDNVVLVEAASRSFGVRPAERYPGIILETDAAGTPIIQNTNEEFHARSLQFELENNGVYQPGYYKWGSYKIKLLDNETMVTEYLEEEKNRLAAAKSFGNDNLKVFFDKRMAGLYWKALKLTKHFGINTIFCLNDTWYGSSYTDWQIIRIDRERLHITIDYRDIPVVHKWVMTITGENELTWEVGMQIKKPINIKHKKMGLFVLPEYKRWFNLSEEGEFPESFNWENLFLNRTDSRSFGVKSFQEYPGILFEIDAQGMPLLQNTDQNFSARAVQFELEENVPDGYYEPGYYKWASAKLKVIDDQRIIDKYIEVQKEKIALVRSFCHDKLKLRFEEERARIYWKDLELSRGFGLNIAVNINGNWYDSSRAEWQFRRISQEKLDICVRYKDVPVTQNWVFNFKENNELVWDVTMQVKETNKIKQKKVSLFLSDEYRHWFNSNEEGEFPRGFNWERIVLNEVDSRGFGVKPEGALPGILFEAGVDGMPLLQNTSEDIKGRAVQFEIGEESNSQAYEPGKEYKLFSGKIKVIENELEIRDYIDNCKILPYDSLDSQTFYIFGDNEDLHNKVAGSINSFKETLDKIRQSLEKNKKVNIKIGVSRFNFFKVKEIVEFSSSLLGKAMDLNSVSLELFPVQKLYFNFVNYLKEIKTKVQIPEIKLVLVDNDLFEVILTVCSQANIYNEKKLLRLLSVVVEHTFIGPQTVVIDPHHRCNVNCLHCWIHTPKITHTQEFLNRKFDFEVYKRMVDDFAELKVDSILFQGDGEPLLYNKFFDMVRYARSKDIEVIFFTNGLLLNNDIAKEAVKLGVSQIFCSLPAGTEKTYALVTHRENEGALGKVLGNLKFLDEVKRQKNKINPRLIMTHVIHTLNYKEIVEMAHNDVEIGADIIRFYLIRLDDNIKFLQLKPEDVESIRKSMCQVKEFLKDKHVELLDTTDFQLNHYEKDSGAWSKGVFLKEGCPLGWFFCLVPALGDISLCCHLRTVGYLKEKSFKELWTSKEYEKYRVQAKYLKDNKDVTFLNGVKLYDEHCEHCDTHQVIRDIQEDLKNYNLYRFAF